jgi:hypothetical protein
MQLSLISREKSCKGKEKDLLPYKVNIVCYVVCCARCIALQNAIQQTDIEQTDEVTPFSIHNAVLLLLAAVHKENYGKSTMILNMNSSTSRKAIYIFYSFCGMSRTHLYRVRV